MYASLLLLHNCDDRLPVFRLWYKSKGLKEVKVASKSSLREIYVSKQKRIPSYSLSPVAQSVQAKTYGR